jgi:parallel beta-helix repeat protein
MISLAGVTNNTANSNVNDGIFISDNIPGSGTTPISGNRADGNGADGIQISSTNSTGYVLSNNTASRNRTGRGITAPGNTDGGGNKATQNASCNTPGCF